MKDTPYQLDGANVFECDESLRHLHSSRAWTRSHNFMSYGDDPCLDQFTRGQNAAHVQDLVRVPRLPLTAAAGYWVTR